MRSVVSRLVGNLRLCVDPVGVRQVLPLLLGVGAARQTLLLGLYPKPGTVGYELDGALLISPKDGGAQLI
jgi:hypothetical protein